MKIARTLIQNGFVELTLSDGPIDDEMSERIETRTRHTLADNQLIAEVHLNALRHVQNVVRAEIQRLEGLKGR